MARMTNLVGLALIAAALSVGIAYTTSSEARGVTMTAGAPTPETVSFHMAMDRLWEDHITYTRNYIISSLGSLDDAGAVAERLLANQADIGNAIKPYYGDEAGDKLAALLKNHIMVATEVVKAAKEGNKDALSAAQAKWTANANDIAAFLAGANPMWSRDDLADMLHKHLEFTTTEVTSRLAKDWAGDIKAYDGGHTHMLKFSNILAQGIIDQFPKKFVK